MIGEALVLLGAVLAAIAALGAVRLRTTLERMHALTKAATGGIVLALIGAALALRTANAVTTLMLALALQLFTFPVGANLIAHAVYRRSGSGIGPASPDDASPDPGRPAEG